MADEIRATPRNPLAALLSDAINSGVGYMKSPKRTQQLQGLGRLIESTGIPYTAQSLSYDPSGRGLFTGSGGLGGTTRMRPEAIEAAMTVAPMVGPANRGLMQATKGLPVGASIKSVGKDLFEASNKYHQKVPEVTNINVANLKRMNSGEVADVSDEVAAKMDFSQPIKVSVFADGEMRIVDGHHRVAAAKKLGIDSLPVELQAINAKGDVLNNLVKQDSYIRYPQQQALDTAQRNAALPVEQGGLGLPPNNTAEMRAKAMGFDVPAYRGSTAKEISHTNPMWWTEDPSYANTYAAHMVKPPIGQPDPYLGNVMPLLVKIGNEKQFEKFSAGGVPLNPFSEFSNDIQTGLKRYPKNDVTGELGGKVWEAVSTPENVRSRFAAFDPMRRTAAIAAAMGLAAPDLLANQMPVNPMYQDPFIDTTR